MFSPISALFQAIGKRHGNNEAENVRLTSNLAMHLYSIMSGLNNLASSTLTNSTMPYPSISIANSYVENVDGTNQNCVEPLGFDCC